MTYLLTKPKKNNTEKKTKKKQIENEKKHAGQG